MFDLKFITIWMSIQDKTQTLLNKLDYLYLFLRLAVNCAHL